MGTVGSPTSPRRSTSRRVFLSRCSRHLLLARRSLPFLPRRSTSFISTTVLQPAEWRRSTHSHQESRLPFLDLLRLLPRNPLSSQATNLDGRHEPSRSLSSCSPLHHSWIFQRRKRLQRRRRSNEVADVVVVLDGSFWKASDVNVDDEPGIVRRS